jgi:NitT/TauT family transport system substrate-binding protein
MGTQPWLGYGQWYVAEDQGFFADQGVGVELTSFNTDADVNAALAGKKLDLASVASHTALQFVENGVDVSIVLMLDTATTADAIITDGSIAKVADLKGQKVAFEEGATSELLLGDALDRAGLTFDDIESVPMGADEAGTALIAGSVPAAVTYEPYVSSALAAGEGFETLVTAAEHEGLISDVLVVRNDVLEAEPDAIRAVIAAWGDSVDFYETNTEEARTIIAAGVGSTVDELASAFDGVRYFTLADNAEMLEGSYRDETLPSIIKVASRIGMIDGSVKPADIINASFLPQP